MVFFIHKRYQEVHSEERAKLRRHQLPSESNREYLGVFDSLHEAIDEARELGYEGANRCLHCFP